MKYAYIQQHRQDYPINVMCKALQVSRSGYYDWRCRKPSTRVHADKELLSHIQQVHKRSRQSYGHLKCWQKLLQEGVQCGRDHVIRLRQANDIYARRRRRFVVTTRSKHHCWIAPNRLERCFTIDAPDKVWVGDVTFIPTRSGWLYLAILLDLFSRKIVGWSMSDSNNGQLVLDALEMAAQRRQPKPGLIHHTDRGSTYAMQSYRNTLQQHGMISSMSRKKDCWDNAVAESFFGNLKNELTYGKNYRTLDEAKSAIFDYIEVFYNRQRLHQTLNYQTPVEFESMYHVA